MNIQKLIAGITTIAFFSTSVLAPAVHSAVSSSTAVTQCKNVFDQLLIPASVGRVTNARYFGSPQVVVTIQDLHCHAEVQRNIARVLQILDKKYSLQNVYIEGATGTLDTSWLMDIPDEKLQNNLMETLVDQGALTGSEYYSLQSKRPLLLKGLEDKTLYRANFARLEKILERQDTYEQSLAQLGQELERFKKIYYSSSNRRFEKLLNQYKNGTMNGAKYFKRLKKYVDTLNRTLPPEQKIRAIDFSRYKNMERYRLFTEQRKKLDYTLVAHEMQQFMQILKQKIPYSAYNTLLEKTDNFTRLDDLYVYLNRLRRELRLDLAGSFPHLEAFFAYNERAEQINPVVMLQEERRLIAELRVGMAANNTEREIAFLADMYGYYADFLRNKLAAGDYVYFENNFEEFRLLWRKYGDNRIFAALENDRKLLNDFYAANLQRNQSFITHSVGSAYPLQQSNQTFSKQQRYDAASMLAQARQVTVLVTGGFHTDGLQKLFDERRISHITITPNITRDTTASDQMYRDLAEQQAKILSQAYALDTITSLVDTLKSTPESTPDMRQLTVVCARLFTALHAIDQDEQKAFAIVTAFASKRLGKKYTAHLERGAEDNTWRLVFPQENADAIVLVYDGKQVARDHSDIDPTSVKLNEKCAVFRVSSPNDAGEKPTPNTTAEYINHCKEILKQKQIKSRDNNNQMISSEKQKALTMLMQLCANNDGEFRHIIDVLEHEEYDVRARNRLMQMIIEHIGKGDNDSIASYINYLSNSTLSAKGFDWHNPDNVVNVLNQTVTNTRIGYLVILAATNNNTSLSQRKKVLQRLVNDGSVDIRYRLFAFSQYWGKHQIAGTVDMSEYHAMIKTLGAPAVSFVADKMLDTVIRQSDNVASLVQNMHFQNEEAQAWISAVFIALQYEELVALNHERVIRKIVRNINQYDAVQSLVGPGEFPVIHGENSAAQFMKTVASSIAAQTGADERTLRAIHEWFQHVPYDERAVAYEPIFCKSVTLGSKEYYLQLMALEDALNDDEEYIRLKAVTGLADMYVEMTEKGQYPYLRDLELMLVDDDEALQKAAGDALKKIYELTNKKNDKFILNKLNDPMPEVRLIALHLIGEHYCRETREHRTLPDLAPIEKCLKDRAIVVRTGAVGVLGEVYAEMLNQHLVQSPKLLEQMLNDPTDSWETVELRAAAEKTLPKIFTVMFRQDILVFNEKTIQSFSPGIQQIAIKGALEAYTEKAARSHEIDLGDMKRIGADPVAMPALRCAALEIVGTVYCADSKQDVPIDLEIFVQALTDVSSEIRAKAVTMLGKIYLERALHNKPIEIGYIMTALDDQDSHVVTAALQALARINEAPSWDRPDGVITRVTSFALRQNTNISVSVEAVRLLGKMLPKGDDYLAPYLRHSNEYVRLAAISAICNIGIKCIADFDEKRLDRIILRFSMLLDDNDETVRGQAVKALVMLYGAVTKTGAHPDMRVVQYLLSAKGAAKQCAGMRILATVAKEKVRRKEQIDLGWFITHIQAKEGVSDEVRETAVHEFTGICHEMFVQGYLVDLEIFRSLLHDSNESIQCDAIDVLRHACANPDSNKDMQRDMRVLENMLAMAACNVKLHILDALNQIYLQQHAKNISVDMNYVEQQLDDDDGLVRIKAQEVVETLLSAKLQAGERVALSSIAHKHRKALAAAALLRHVDITARSPEDHARYLLWRNTIRCYNADKMKLYFDAPDHWEIIQAVQRRAERNTFEGFAIDNKRQSTDAYIHAIKSGIDMSFKEYANRMSILARFEIKYPGHFSALFRKVSRLKSFEVSAKGGRQLQYSAADVGVFDQALSTMLQDQQRIDTLDWVTDYNKTIKDIYVMVANIQKVQNGTMVAVKQTECTSKPQRRLSDNEIKEILLRDKKSLYIVLFKLLQGHLHKRDPEKRNRSIKKMKDVIISYLLTDTELIREMKSKDIHIKTKAFQMAFEECSNNLPKKVGTQITAIAGLKELLSEESQDIMREIAKVNPFAQATPGAYVCVPVSFLGLFRGRAGFVGCSFDIDCIKGVPFTRAMHEDTIYYFVYNKEKKLAGYLGMMMTCTPEGEKVLAINTINAPSLDGEAVLKELFRQLRLVARDLGASDIALPEPIGHRYKPDPSDDGMSFNFENALRIEKICQMGAGRVVRLQPLHKKSWERFTREYRADKFNSIDRREPLYRLLPEHLFMNADEVTNSKESAGSSGGTASMLGSDENYVKRAPRWEWLFQIPFINLRVASLFRWVSPSWGRRITGITAFENDMAGRIGTPYGWVRVLSDAASLAVAAAFVSGEFPLIIAASVAWMLVSARVFADGHQWTQKSEEVFRLGKIAVTKRAVIFSVGVLLSGITFAPLAMLAYADISILGWYGLGMLSVGVVSNVVGHWVYNTFIGHKRGIPASVMRNADDTLPLPEVRNRQPDVFVQEELMPALLRCSVHDVEAIDRILMQYMQTYDTQILLALLRALHAGWRDAGQDKQAAYEVILDTLFKRFVSRYDLKAITKEMFEELYAIAAELTVLEEKFRDIQERIDPELVNDWMNDTRHPCAPLVDFRSYFKGIWIYKDSIPQQLLEEHKGCFSAVVGEEDKVYCRGDIEDRFKNHPNKEDITTLNKVYSAACRRRYFSYTTIENVMLRGDTDFLTAYFINKLYVDAIDFGKRLDDNMRKYIVALLTINTEKYDNRQYIRVLEHVLDGYRMCSGEAASRDIAKNIHALISQRKEEMKTDEQLCMDTIAACKNFLRSNHSERAIDDKNIDRVSFGAMQTLDALLSCCLHNEKEFQALMEIIRTAEYSANLRSEMMRLMTVVAKSGNQLVINGIYSYFGVQGKDAGQLTPDGLIGFLKDTRIEERLKYFTLLVMMTSRLDSEKGRELMKQIIISDPEIPLQCRLYAFARYWEQYGMLADDRWETYQDMLKSLGAETVRFVEDVMSPEQRAAAIKKITALYNDPLLQSEEAVVYTTAVFIAVQHQQMAAYTSYDGVSETLRYIVGAQLFGDYHNMNSAFQLGWQTDVNPVRIVDEFFSGIAHELFHRILDDEYNFLSDSESAAAVHEMVSYAASAVFLGLCGSDYDPIGTNIAYSGESVELRQGSLNEEHEAIMQLAVFKNVGIAIDKVFLQNILHMVREKRPELKGKQFQDIMAVLLDEYFDRKDTDKELLRDPKNAAEQGHRILVPFLQAHPLAFSFAALDYCFGSQEKVVTPAADLTGVAVYYYLPEEDNDDIPRIFKSKMAADNSVSSHNGIFITFDPIDVWMRNYPNYHGMVEGHPVEAYVLTRWLHEGGRVVAVPHIYISKPLIEHDTPELRRIIVGKIIQELVESKELDRMLYPKAIGYRPAVIVTDPASARGLQADFPRAALVTVGHEAGPHDLPGIEKSYTNSEFIEAGNDAIMASFGAAIRDKKAGDNARNKSIIVRLPLLAADDTGAPTLPAIQQENIINLMRALEKENLRLLGLGNRLMKASEREREIFAVQRAALHKEGVNLHSDYPVRKDTSTAVVRDNIVFLLAQLDGLELDFTESGWQPGAIRDLLVSLGREFPMATLTAKLDERTSRQSVKNNLPSNVFIIQDVTVAAGGVTAAADDECARLHVQGQPGMNGTLEDVMQSITGALVEVSLIDMARYGNPQFNNGINDEETLSSISGAVGYITMNFMKHNIGVVAAHFNETPAIVYETVLGYEKQDLPSSPIWQELMRQVAGMPDIVTYLKTDAGEMPFNRQFIDALQAANIGDTTASGLKLQKLLSRMNAAKKEQDVHRCMALLLKFYKGITERMLVDSLRETTGDAQFLAPADEKLFGQALLQVILQKRIYKITSAVNYVARFKDQAIRVTPPHKDALQVQNNILRETTVQDAAALVDYVMSLDEKDLARMAGKSTEKSLFLNRAVAHLHAVTRMKPDQAAGAWAALLRLLYLYGNRKETLAVDEQKLIQSEIYRVLLGAA